MSKHLSSVSLVLVLSVAACSPPGSDSKGSGDNGATPPGATGGPDAGGGAGGNAAGGNTVAPPPAIKSSCAPANVKLGVPVTTAIHAGNYVRNIVAADLNRDGKADIIVLEDNGIESFISKGDGTFGSGAYIETISGLGYALAAGDFQGKGMADVIASGADPNDSTELSQAFFGNSGDGTLASVAKFVPVTTNYSLKAMAGDMNGDGKLDFVYDNYQFDKSAGFVLNSGGGSFANPTGFALGTVWTLGDLNGDGSADIVQGPPDGNHHGVCFRLNKGTGQLGDYVCQPGPAAHDGLVTHVATGDINGDGKMDFLGLYDNDAGFTDQSNIAVYLGKGDGTFGDRKLAALQQDIVGVVLADMNNDGKADIVTFAGQSDASSLVDVLLGNGDGTFASSPLEMGAGRIQGGSEQLPVVADVAGNGLRTIVVHNSAKNGFDTIVSSCKQ